MSAGMPGFGRLRPEFAVGSVTGVRWWNLDLAQDRPQLRGMYEKSLWSSGENVARCHGGTCPPPHPRCTCPAAQLACEVPCECGRCGCGFWAYWLLDTAPDARSCPAPVLGVIEGYGATTIGGKGFRSAKARILGIHMPRVTDTDPLSFGYDKDAHRLERLKRVVTDPEGLARIALLELVAAGAYGVPAYASAEALLASHPPTTDYLEEN